jgi:mycothione reductase
MASHSYDLVIVGAGSGNMLLTDEFAGWRVAVAESDRFGGTCLNRGCIPSKMLVHTADVAQTVRHAGWFGIGAKWVGADWPAIHDRVFGRIDPLHEQAVAHRRAGDVDVYLGEARFGGPKVLRVGGDEIRAERFVLAAGSRPAIPALPGLSEVPYLTSDTVMRVGRLPGSMVVLGGGYIAAEMSPSSGRSAPGSPSWRAASTSCHATTSTSGSDSRRVMPNASTCGRAPPSSGWRRPAKGSASTWRPPPVPGRPRLMCC